MMKKEVFLLIVIFACVQCKLPSYLKACPKNDPNFSECAKQSGIAAIPSIIKGDKELHIPKMNPLVLPKITVDASDSLKMKFTDIIVDGLQDAQITDVKVDLDKMHAEISAHFDRLNMITTYNIEGKILILPIQGNGPANITFVQPDFTFFFDWKLSDKNGKQYATITNHRIIYKLKRAYYHLDNLFNGDKRLGEEMNKFLDENWADVDKDLGPAIAETVSAVCNSIARGVYERIPYEELFV